MENYNKPTKILWRTLEHNHKKDQTIDWFWGLWIIAIGGAILSFYFGNILFGIIIILFSVTAALMVNKKPQMTEFEISRQGIRIEKILYPFPNLESFWVKDTERDDVIIIRTKKTLEPFLILPFDSTVTDAEMIRDYLLDYLDEEHMEEPLHQKLMEYLGF